MLKFISTRDVNVNRDDLHASHYDAWPVGRSLVRTGYTDPVHVRAVGTTDAPYNRSVTGYGPKLPTRYAVLYRGDFCKRAQWRRVYVACYGNSGTAYIVVNGRMTVLDNVTESHLMTS